MACSPAARCAWGPWRSLSSCGPCGVQRRGKPGQAAPTSHKQSRDFVPPRPRPLADVSPPLTERLAQRRRGEATNTMAAGRRGTRRAVRTAEEGERTQSRGHRLREPPATDNWAEREPQRSRSAPRAGVPGSPQNSGDRPPGLATRPRTPARLPAAGGPRPPWGKVAATSVWRWLAHEGRLQRERPRPSSASLAVGARGKGQQSLRSGGLAGPTEAESPRTYSHPEW